MKSKIIEASTGFNWGKFMVLQWERSDWETPSVVDEGSNILSARGHSVSDLMVFDLETCEGAIFSPWGLARADLHKHAIWVCILFEPFLQWLYGQSKAAKAEHGWFNIDTLPNLVDLSGVPPALHGYRRDGPVAALALKALESDDPEMVALAETVAEGLGIMPKRKPPTLADVQEWCGPCPE